MAQCGAAVTKPPDLNKPLPLCPAASIISNQSKSSCSRYSTDIGTAASLPYENDCGITNRERHALPTSDALLMPNTTTRTHSIDSKLQHPVSDSRVYTYPDTSGRATMKTIQDFRATNYDDLSERPLFFHPQTTLIDLPVGRRRKKISLSKWFKSKSHKRHDVRSRKAQVTQMIPPRPKRPPRHLCPSPPFNPANMPSWKNLSNVNQDKFMEDCYLTKTNESLSKIIPDNGIMSTLTTSRTNQPNKAFVGHFDLYHNRGHRNDTFAPVTNFSRKATKIPDGARQESTFVNHLTTSHNDAVCAGISHETYEFTIPAESSRSIHAKDLAKAQHIKNYGPAIQALKHVPEHKSLESFTQHEAYYRDQRKRCSYRISPESPSCARPRSRNQSDLIFTTTKELDGNGRQMCAAPESEYYQHERDRIRAVSERLRVQYRDEWDAARDEHLQSAESLTASYSELGERYFHEDFLANNEKNFRYGYGRSNPNPALQSQGGQWNYNDPRLSRMIPAGSAATTARARPGVTVVDRVREDWTINEDNRDSYGIDLSNLIPAPLRSNNHWHSPRTGYPQISNPTSPNTRQAHKQDSLISISSTSLLERDRIFTGSNFESPLIGSPATEPGVTTSEPKSRSPSPYLPTPPSLPRRPRSPVTPPYPPARLDSAWDLRRVRSALRLSTADPVQFDHTLRRIKSITSSQHRYSLTEPDIYETNSVYNNMWGHDQKPSLELSSPISKPKRPPRPDSPPPLPLLQQFSTPSPPPVPKRSTKRRTRQSTHQAPVAENTTPKSELNGELALTPSTSRSDSVSGSSGSDSEKSTKHRSQASQYSVSEDAHQVEDIGPFRKMKFRGKSIMYHVDANGECTF